jgi:hypothetical protein
VVPVLRLYPDTLVFSVVDVVVSRLLRLELPLVFVSACELFPVPLSDFLCTLDFLDDVFLVTRSSDKISFFES